MRGEERATDPFARCESECEKFDGESSKDSVMRGRRTQFTMSIRDQRSPLYVIYAIERKWLRAINLNLPQPKRNV